MSLIKKNQACLLVVFDLETTGISTYKDNIFDLGAVACRLFESKFQSIGEIFQSFCFTDKKINKHALRLLKLEQKQIQDLENQTLTPPFKKVLKFWGEWLQRINPLHEPILLCGHNNINFDMTLIYHQGLRENVDMYTFWRQHEVIGVLDTLKLAKKKFGSKGNTLMNLHQKLFQEPFEDAHTALADAKATLAILCHPEIWSCVDRNDGSLDYLTLDFNKQDVQRRHELWLRKQNTTEINHLPVTRSSAPNKMYDLDENDLRKLCDQCQQMIREIKNKEN